ncbi:MAG: hypothetical protein QOK16_2967 [Solirubrobacteraceae bacterium]|nr:hypothetical protein [Solirubrobacteraceae bacterium]
MKVVLADRRGLAGEPFDHRGGLRQTADGVRPRASVALNELDHDVVGGALIAVGERVEVTSRAQ